MSRRKKSSPAEDFIALLAKFPWWAGAALAVLSCVLLHKVANEPMVAATELGK